MEASFGHDFSTVRVREADRGPAANSIAFARGEELHFQPGSFRPESLAGQKLIGHELAHVVQQRQGRVRATGALGRNPVNEQESLESEAHLLGDRAALGQPARTTSGHTSGCACAACGGALRLAGNGPAGVPGTPVMQMAHCKRCGSTEHETDNCPQPSTSYVPHSGVEPTADLESQIQEALKSKQHKKARTLAAEQAGIPSYVRVKKKSSGRASTSGGFRPGKPDLKPPKLKVSDKVLKEELPQRRSTLRHEGEHLRQRRDREFMQSSSKAIREGLAYSYEFNRGQSDPPSEKPKKRRQRKQAKKTVKYLTGGGSSRWGATREELERFGDFLRPTVERAVEEDVPLSDQLLSQLGGSASSSVEQERGDHSPSPRRSRSRSRSTRDRGRSRERRRSPRERKRSRSRSPS